MRLLRHIKSLQQFRTPNNKTSNKKGTLKINRKIRDSGVVILKLVSSAPFSTKKSSLVQLPVSYPRVFVGVLYCCIYEVTPPYPADCAGCRVSSILDDEIKTEDMTHTNIAAVVADNDTSGTYTNDSPGQSEQWKRGLSTTAAQQYRQPYTHSTGTT